jgi:hypothetical protein
MLDGVIAFVYIDVVAGSACMKIFGDEVADVEAVFGAQQKLKSIAGGEHKRFSHTGLLQVTEYLWKSAFGDGESLTHVDGCGLVIDTGHNDVHQRTVNLWANPT